MILKLGYESQVRADLLEGWLALQDYCCSGAMARHYHEDSRILLTPIYAIALGVAGVVAFWRRHAHYC